MLRRRLGFEGVMHSSPRLTHGAMMVMCVGGWEEICQDKRMELNGVECMNGAVRCVCRERNPSR